MNLIVTNFLDQFKDIVCCYNTTHTWKTKSFYWFTQRVTRAITSWSTVFSISTIAANLKERSISFFQFYFRQIKDNNTMLLYMQYDMCLFYLQATYKK